MMLHNASCQRYTATHGTTHSIKSKTFKTVEIKVAQMVRAEYLIPDNVSPIISDIQSETASVKESDDSLLARRDQRYHGPGRQDPCRVLRLLDVEACNMCAGMINDVSDGNAKVFWGQDDPGKMAVDTKLEQTKMGSLLDGNKAQNGARAILLGDTKKPMSQQLDASFTAQKRGGEKSTIDYIVTDEAAIIVKEAEKFLKAKQQKYGMAPTDFNENTAFVVRYLTEFMGKLGLQPENLGV